MSAIVIYLMLAKRVTLPPNPCSNPVKCESYRRLPTGREGRGRK